MLPTGLRWRRSRSARRATPRPMSGPRLAHAKAWGRKTSSTVCASISPMMSPCAISRPSPSNSRRLSTDESAAPTLRCVSAWLGCAGARRPRLGIANPGRHLPSGPPQGFPGSSDQRSAISGHPEQPGAPRFTRPMAPSINAGRDRATPPDRAWRSASWTSWRPASSPPRRSFGGEGAR